MRKNTINYQSSVLSLLKISTSLRNTFKIISLFILVGMPNVFFAQLTYTVNTTDDTNDGTCDANHCSLREALRAANRDDVNSNIHFNISGAAPFIIQPSTALPDIMVDGTILDGSTQPNWKIGDVVIDGSNAGNQGGLHIRATASNCSIFGMQVQKFTFTGIKIGDNVLTDTCKNITIGAPNKGNIVILSRGGIGSVRAENITIQNNYLGTDENFTKGLGNEFGGIECEVDGDQIIIQHNITSGNDYKGIGVGPVRTILIKDNFIGMDTTGNIDLGNGKYGILCNNPQDITIENNWIGYNVNSGLFIRSDTAKVINNFIGTAPSGQIDMGHFWYGIYHDVGVLQLKNNHIAYNRYGVQSNVDIENSQNSLFCNTTSGLSIDLEDLTNKKTPPIINRVTTNIEGISEIGDTVEIFISDQLNCTAPCQGKTFLGSVVADGSGAWELPTPDTLKNGDVLTATATNTSGRTSEFSICFIVLPDECAFPQILSIQDEPCSSIGTVLDLKQLTASTPPPSSMCSSTFVGNDAWYTLKVPSTGNLLIRANINNEVIPVIEAYTGTCNNLILQQCEVLDSIPFAMVFENYTPETTIYLRVWDKGNIVVNSPNAALLHLTAHKLDLQKDNWQICDLENNLINGNPTILSERDANNFILEYDKNATPEEIAALEQLLTNDGAILIDNFVCNAAKLQLWKTVNPIEMEDCRKAAKKRGNVDTTNYNYVFETIEFQVNSYAIGQQYATDVAMDVDGNFAMVWTDAQRGHNYGRVYKSSGNPITQEFQIGASDKRQFISSIAMDDNGNFMVVWHEINAAMVAATFRVYGRQYYANGAPKDVAFEISLTAELTAPNDSTVNKIARYGVNPKVDLDASGNFVVVWHANKGIFAQRYNNSAALVGNIISLGNSLNNISEPQPAIAVNNTGAFVVVWTGLDTNETGIFLQQYDNTGNPIGSIISANTTQQKIQAYPDVALQEDGSFIIVWESYEQEGINSDYGVFGQRFDANGNKVGTEFQINSYTTDAQRMPSISLFEDGTFAVAWSSLGQDGFAEGIYAKMFDSAGNPIAPAFDDSAKGSVGEEFRMNAYEAPEQERPRTATNGQNIFMGAWEDGANDGSFTGIFAQRYEIIKNDNTKIFYPIGTATPSTLLGDPLNFIGEVYNPETTNKRVKVGLIDTGIDSDHPHLVNALWTNLATNDPDNCVLLDTIGYDFVNENGNPNDIDGHGTKVNGIITRDFATGVQLELMNLKFHETNRGSVFDAISAIYYAVDNGVNILNLSWGFEAAEFPSILNRALKYAADNDVLIITTAGNTSKNNDQLNKYPANLEIDNMIVVTAYEYRQATGEKRLANYASYGKENVDIAAYGFVESPTVGGTLEVSAGTSLAAPLVARTAAIIKGQYPMLSASEIKDCILSTAESVTALSNLVATGGILDHDTALVCAASKAAIFCSERNFGLTAVVNNETCQRNDGSIEVTINDSISNPNFFWSIGDTSQNLTNLTTGTYQLIVTDSLACPDTLEVIIALDCANNLCNTTDAVLNNQPILGGTYHSNTTIESAGTVDKDSIVTFKAVQSITFNPGFEVVKGADFTAMVAACGNTLTESLENASNRSVPESVEQRIIKELQLKLTPNPTTNQSTVHYYLPATNKTRISLHTINGQKLYQGDWQHLNKGWHQHIIEVAGSTGGVYFVSLQTSKNVLTKKLMVLP